MGLVNIVPATVVDVAGERGTVLAGSSFRLDMPVPDGTLKGDAIEIAIRPENIVLDMPNGSGSALAKVTERTFLGNINEYYATLDAGPVLRIQTHPLQQFAIGDTVAVKVDSSQCSVFRAGGAEPGVAVQ
jgi:iron(III) transport system ATP-binding protein